MMRLKRAREPGMALVLVLGIVLVASIMVAGLYVLLRSRMDDLNVVSDRMKAQYLCEAGVSVALLDMSHGALVPGASKTFNFNVGSNWYAVTYVANKIAGQWEIQSSVNSPVGTGLVYTLRVGGQRAFPIFIIGIPGVGL